MAITTIWAVSLTISAAILAAVIHDRGGVLVRIVFQVLGFVVPMAATRRYVKIVHARAHQAAGYPHPGMHVRSLSRATLAGTRPKPSFRTGSCSAPGATLRRQPGRARGSGRDRAERRRERDRVQGFA
jgi:hypothetical protein